MNWVDYTTTTTTTTTQNEAIHLFDISHPAVLVIDTDTLI